MQLRKVRKPTIGMVRDGNSIMLRFLSGKNEGRPVPVRTGVFWEIVCARCELPSYPGLPPFVKALGFDRETGQAEEQYVHERCPSNVAECRAAIAADRRRRQVRALELAKLPKPRLSWNAFQNLLKR